MKKYLLENWNYLIILFLVASLVVGLAVLMVPHGKVCYGEAPWFLNCDYSLWFDATKNFPYSFKFGNILIHRPLFAGIDWLIYKPVRKLLPATISGDFGIFVISWRLQNILFYFGLVVLAYDIGRRMWSKRAGFWLALLIATSNHCYAWLMQPLNNIQGFFITFATWWMVLDWHQEKILKRKNIKLLGYSLMFGCLMLGKAMYNLLGTILIIGFWQKRYRKETLIFLFLQFLPLVVWIMFINWYLKTPYHNYEARFGITYFVIQYFKGVNNWVVGWSRLEDIAKTALGMVSNSIGWLATIFGLAYLGKVLNKREGVIWVVYLLMTTGLLFASSFLLNRHSPDYWPLLYGGSAYWLDQLVKKSGKLGIVMTPLIIVLILMIMTISFLPESITAAGIF